MISSICKLMTRLRKDQRGLSAVEYAVLGGIIVGGLALAGGTFSTAVQNSFQRMTGSVNSAGAAPASS